VEGSLEALGEMCALCWFYGDASVVPISADTHGDFRKLLWDERSASLRCTGFMVQSTGLQNVHFLDLAQDLDVDDVPGAVRFAGFEQFLERWLDRFHYPYLEEGELESLRQLVSSIMGTGESLQELHALPKAHDLRNARRFCLSLFEALFWLVEHREEVLDLVRSVKEEALACLIPPDAGSTAVSRDDAAVWTEELELREASLSERLDFLALHIVPRLGYIFDAQVEPLLTRRSGFLHRQAVLAMERVQWEEGVPRVKVPALISQDNAAGVKEHTSRVRNYLDARGLLAHDTLGRFMDASLGLALGLARSGGGDAVVECLSASAGRAVAALRALCEEGGRFKGSLVAAHLSLHRALGETGFCGGQRIDSQPAHLSLFRDSVLLHSRFSDGDGASAWEVWQQRGQRDAPSEAVEGALLAAPLLGWASGPEEVAAVASRIVSLTHADPRCVAAAVSVAVVLAGILRCRIAARGGAGGPREAPLTPAEVTDILGAARDEALKALEEIGRDARDGLSVFAALKPSRPEEWELAHRVSLHARGLNDREARQSRKPVEFVKRVGSQIVQQFSAPAEDALSRGLGGFSLFSTDVARRECDEVFDHLKSCAGDAGAAWPLFPSRWAAVIEEENSRRRAELRRRAADVADRNSENPSAPSGSRPPPHFVYHQYCWTPMLLAGAALRSAAATVSASDAFALSVCGLPAGAKELRQEGFAVIGAVLGAAFGRNAMNTETGEPFGAPVDPGLDAWLVQHVDFAMNKVCKLSQVLRTAPGPSQALYMAALAKPKASPTKSLDSASPKARNSTPRIGTKKSLSYGKGTSKGPRSPTAAASANAMPPSFRMDLAEG